MDFIRKIIRDLEIRIEALERNLTLKKLTIPSDGYLVPKVLSSDPTTPQTNEVWINSSTNQLKWFNGTATKAVTLS